MAWNSRWYLMAWNSRWYLDVAKNFIWFSKVQWRHCPLSWVFPSPPHRQFQDQHNTAEKEKRTSTLIFQRCKTLQFFVKITQTWYCCFLSVCTPLFMNLCHPFLSLSDLSIAAVLYNDKSQYLKWCHAIITTQHAGSRINI